MKMITKVFLVIAILLICLIAWALFLGDGGIIQNAWNGVADMVNEVWMTITGSDKGVVPQWKSDINNQDAGMTDIDNGGNVVAPN